MVITLSVFPFFKSLYIFVEVYFHFDYEIVIFDFIPGLNEYILTVKTIYLGYY